MLKTNKITCDALVIMAGGQSTRMGSDKASLPFGQYSVIEYMIDHFRPYFKDIYVSVAEKKQLEALKLEERYGVHKIVDVYRQCGPMGGLYAVFAQTELEHFCVCAVDMPFATPEVLLDCVPEDKDIGYSVAAHKNGKIQPLFGWYHRSIYSTLHMLINRHQYKMMQIYDLCQGKRIIVEAAAACGQCFFNMNDRQCYYDALDYIRTLEMKRNNDRKITNPKIKRHNLIPLISFAAWSGTGKTTYLEKLIPILLQKNIKVAVIKHDGHDFEIDVEGKDTDRFFKAGAQTVLISSQKKCAWIHKNMYDLCLDELVSYVSDVDLILVEGFKYGNQPKIELYRSNVCAHLMENITNRVAVVSDCPIQADVPVFSLENFSEVADFLVDYIKCY